MTRTSEYCCMWEVVTGSDHKVFGVAAKSLDLGVRPAGGMGRLMALMAFPFLPEKVLPFNLEPSRKVPGRKPTFHLCHGVIQEISFFGPNCVLEIGFREEKGSR